MTRSEQLFERAVKRIPGGVNSPVRSYGAIGEAPRFIEKADKCYIYDVDGKNYYMISLFLVTPENPDKTDLLHLDRMGQEMMDKMSYMKKDIYMEYALPEDKADEFNHLK